MVRRCKFAASKQDIFRGGATPIPEPWLEGSVVSLQSYKAPRRPVIKRPNMAAPDANTTVIEVPSPQEAQAPSEKSALAAGEVEKLKGGIPDSPEIQAAPPAYDVDSSQEKDDDSDDHIIITGSDAAAHLLPLRDDGDPALSFRSLFLATCLSAFQAVMYQIYVVC